MERPPRLLTIAGSDSGGGAGIQADLKTFAAYGAYGMSAITAVTAQNTCRVVSIEEISPGVVADQIDAVFEDIGVDAIKIGMLANAEIAAAVADRLDAYPPTPTVLDPVMIAKSGDRLLSDEAVAVVRERLLPRATVLTPNLPEAACLLDRSAEDLESEAERRGAARALVEAGASSVLVKGGHAPAVGLEEDVVVDHFYDGGRDYRYARPRLMTRSTHGTGCTLSSAIAAGLGSGMELAGAVERAGEYLHRAIETAFPLGKGHGPVNHLYRIARR